MKAWLGLEKLLLRWLTHRELVVPLYRCSNDVDQLSPRRHSPRWNKALSFKSQRSWKSHTIVSYWLHISAVFLAGGDNIGVRMSGEEDRWGPSWGWLA